MNSRLKNALLAVAAAGLASSAQATYTTGDLLVGFDKSGAATDFVYDIGPYSSLTDGETWSLGSLLQATDPKFATLDNVEFGVVGANNSTKTIYSTTDGSFVPQENVNAFNTLRSAVGTIGGGIGVGAVSGASYGSPDVGSGKDWNANTLNPTLASQFGSYWNPNAVSPGPAYLFASDNSGDQAVGAGSFTLANDGTLTFNVPEPGTGLLAGVGLLTLALRLQRLRRA